MQDPLAFEAVAARDVHMQVQMKERLMDVSAPIRIGDQRIGGVRIGYSLESVMDEQHRATEAMQARMDDIGYHHALWIVLMMLVLVAIGVVVSLVVQRSLVRPIRQLANAAREIEAGNFAAEVPVIPRNDEVGELTRQFSPMGHSIVRHARPLRRLASTHAPPGPSNRPP